MSSEKAVREQVEYYFSDANFPRDKFLRGKCEQDEDGFCDIEVLLTFNNLKKLGATVESISKAVSSSDVVVLDDSKQRLKRKHPLPEKNEWKARTIYAKGWGAGTVEPSVQDMKDLFSPSGDVSSVRWRRWKDPDESRHFKGSIFIEFATAEMAERAAAEEYSITVLGVEKKLIVMTADDYFIMKSKENRERRERMKKRWLEKQAKESNGVGKTENGKTENGVKPEDKDEDEDVKEEPKEETKPKRELQRGMVLKFEGVGPNLRRHEVKKAFQELGGDVAWVGFKDSDTDGVVRFGLEGDAKKIVDAITENKAEIGGSVPKVWILEGEEEEEWWKAAWEKMDAAGQKRRHEGGGGRGGKRRRGGFRGRGRRNQNRS